MGFDCRRGDKRLEKRDILDMVLIVDSEYIDLSVITVLGSYMRLESEIEICANICFARFSLAGAHPTAALAGVKSASIWAILLLVGDFLRAGRHRRSCPILGSYSNSPGSRPPI